MSAPEADRPRIPQVPHEPLRSVPSQGDEPQSPLAIKPSTAPGAEYYYGFPWSLTRFRDEGVLKELLKKDPSKWDWKTVEDVMLAYLEEKLGSELGFWVKSAVYESRFHSTYQEFVADMVKVKDEDREDPFEIPVLVLTHGTEDDIQRVPDPPQYKVEGFRKLLEAHFGPPRWWRASPSNHTTQYCDWFNPRTGEYRDDCRLTDGKETAEKNTEN